MSIPPKRKTCYSSIIEDIRHFLKCMRILYENLSLHLQIMLKWLIRDLEWWEKNSNVTTLFEVFSDMGYRDKDLYATFLAILGLRYLRSKQSSVWSATVFSLSVISFSNIISNTVYPYLHSLLFSPSNAFSQQCRRSRGLSRYVSLSGFALRFPKKGSKIVIRIFRIVFWVWIKCFRRTWSSVCRLLRHDAL